MLDKSNWLKRRFSQSHHTQVRYWLLLTLIVFSLFIYYRYTDFVRSPNDHLMTMGFDGVKNYFTTAWHLKHDNERLGYSGMNYPYGEHVLFTDNQPLLVNTARLFTDYFPGLKDQGVAVINLFQLFSLLLSVCVIFVLFHRLQLPGWYAGILAILMVLLTPQHDRFSAHFGLSHAWIIPLLLLLLHSYEQRTYRRRVSFTIGLLAFLVAQLHMYYFGLFFLFITTYELVSYLRQPRRSGLIKRMVHWMLMLLVPYGALQFWLKAAHFSADRPANPYGFLTYRGYWEGIFLPYPTWPLYKWIDKNITPIRIFDGEAASYVGAIATLFFLLVVLRGFRVFPKGEITSFGERLNRNYLRNIWWSAVILALFSCGFPHAIKGLDWIAEYYGPIRQFRSMGRFNWMTFYVFNTVAFFWIWHFANKREIIWQKVLILALPLCLFAFEAYQMQHYKPAMVYPNCFTKNSEACLQPDWFAQLDTARFQAIYPVPYYHSGSENLFLEPKYDLYLYTARTAYNTGLPDMGVNMSRTSIGQMVKSAQLMLEPLEMPRILRDIVSHKSLALLSTPEYMAEVKNKYQHLLRKAEQKFASDKILLYELPYDSLQLAFREAIDTAKQEIRAKNLPLKVWTKNNPNAFLYHESYDSLTQASSALGGKGAFEGRMSDTTYVFRNGLKPGWYACSFWIDVRQDMGMTSELRIAQRVGKDGPIAEMLHEGCRFHLKAIRDGWALFDIGFEIKADDRFVEIYFHKKGVSAPFRLDEVEVRSHQTDSWYRDPRNLVKNNRWYQE